MGRVRRKTLDIVKGNYSNSEHAFRSTTHDIMTIKMQLIIIKIIAVMMSQLTLCFIVASIQVKGTEQCKANQEQQFKWLHVTKKRFDKRLAII